MIKYIRRLALVAFAGASLVACDPFIMIPGGELSGNVKPTPTDWEFSNAIETVQLETRPSDPYSVNVWGTAAGEDFYVAAGKSTTSWAAHIADDPNVRLKLGDDIYPLKAVRTQKPEDLEAFLVAVKQKYDFEPDPDQRSDAVLFKLVDR
jgi:hypothetical protein